jgi:hypothetical protein
MLQRSEHSWALQATIGYLLNNFSKISHPITSLQKKGVKFQWTLDFERSFQHLKQLLISSPILRIADPNEDFNVCIDACKEGPIGVLSQNGFCHVLWVKEVKGTWKTLCHSWFGIGSYSACLEEMEKLPHGKKNFELRIDHNGLKYFIWLAANCKF